MNWTVNAAKALSRRPGLPLWAPGIALAVVLAAIALALASLQQQVLRRPLIESLVIALLLGTIARNMLPTRLVLAVAPGAALAAKQLLEMGVALMGAGLAIGEVTRAGPSLMVLIGGGVAAGIGVSFLIGRALGLETKLAFLVAVGNSICGNSAIAAVAPVIRAEKKDVVSAIGLTAVIGLCVVLGLPLLIAPLALSHYEYGVMAGMSLYAVPQVIAAAFPISQLSGEVATLVKLTRVLMLGPVVLAAGLLFRGGAASRKLSSYLPWFVAAFLGLAVLRSLGLLPVALIDPTREVSRLLTILAMAGLGFGVELATVRQVGARVGVAVVGSLIFIAIFTFAMIRLLGIDG